MDFCNGKKMFPMSFEIAPENAPRIHWGCQVVPQASRRVVWGVLSKLTISKTLAIRTPISIQIGCLGDFILNASITGHQGPKFGGFLFFKQVFCPLYVSQYLASKQSHSEKVWISLNSPNSWDRVLTLFLPPHTQEGCVVVRNHSKMGTVERLTLFLIFP